MKTSQKGRILAVLYDGREHSTVEFVEMKPAILRSGARLWELRDEGYAITRTRLAPATEKGEAPVAWWRWHEDCPRRAEFAKNYDFRQVEPDDPRQGVMELGGG